MHYFTTIEPCTTILKAFIYVLQSEKNMLQILFWLACNTTNACRRPWRELGFKNFLGDSQFPTLKHNLSDAAESQETSKHTLAFDFGAVLKSYKPCNSQAIKLYTTLRCHSKSSWCGYINITITHTLNFNCIYGYFTDLVRYSVTKVRKSLQGQSLHVFNSAVAYIRSLLSWELYYLPMRISLQHA